jgi:hypothetical protein
MPFAVWHCLICGLAHRERSDAEMCELVHKQTRRLGLDSVSARKRGWPKRRDAQEHIDFETGKRTHDE